jgi:hypothetical protein
VRLSRPLAAWWLVMAMIGGTIVSAPRAVAAEAEAGATVEVIVTLAPTAEEAEEVAERHGVEVSSVFEHVLDGFAAEIPADQLAALALDPAVAAVEPVVEIELAEVPTGVERIHALQNPTARLGQRVAIDADVAILDTGVDGNHPDLNVVGGVDCTMGACIPVATPTDVLGHGTHVAGIIAAKDNGWGVVGVAPGARIWSVKVFTDSGAGSSLSVLRGLEWVIAHGGIEAANMSFGAPGATPWSISLALAFAKSTGVVLVAAAGNQSTSNTYWPAEHPAVISVSAIADFDGKPGGKAGIGDDTRAPFSNYGPGVDLAAPGVSIKSTLPGSRYGLASGTSMAAPHVAGAALLYLTANQLAATPWRADTVKAGLLASWSTPAASDCGYQGSISGEPLLLMAPCQGDQSHRFRDVTGDALSSATEWMAEKGITAGCGGGRFCPDSQATRAEMATFLSRALNLPASSNDYFTDDHGHPLQGFLNRAAAAGLLAGCGPGKVCPDSPMTRAELATVLVRAYQLSASTPRLFGDTASHWARPFISVFGGLGLSAGCDPAGRFYCPDRPVTRAEISLLMWRIAG